MARQFGIITTITGVTSIVINSLKKSESVEVAEARNEKGEVTDLKPYSKGENITIDGVLDAAECAVAAGDTLTIKTKSYLITNVDRSETNTGAATVSIQARTADAATIGTYGPAA